MSIRLVSSIALMGILVVGCGDDGGLTKASPDGGRSTVISVKGSVVGTQIPDEAKAVVIWSVTSGSPDYTYKYGEGSFGNARFAVDLPLDPPAEIFNSYGIAIGLVALVPQTATIPDGKVNTDELGAPLGLSTEYAIIWKKASAKDLSWTSPFPVGPSCGICIPALEGKVFDSFTPLDCSNLRVETASDPDELHTCNWT